MDRCRLLVEGQTEETFTNRMLAPHLYEFGLQEVTAIVVETKRAASGRKHAGGVQSWAQIERDIRRLVSDSGALITTMFDFYGLPADVPGFEAVQQSVPAQLAVEHIEAAIFEEVGMQNFVPFVMLHEFEALLYADPSAIGHHFGSQSLAARLEADLVECGVPELVDNGAQTAPSKRIARHQPGYLKTSDGPTILADVGLPMLRSKCEHFDDWLKRIEARVG